MRRLIDRAELFLTRLHRAWRYYRKLHYTWRLSWLKAGYGTIDEHADIQHAGTR